MKQLPGVSIVIPTLGREQVLLDTLACLLALARPAAEILVVDQTVQHESATHAALTDWEQAGSIRWLRRPAPSIPAAMNQGLTEATQEVVLFLDDDIVPWPDLVHAHQQAHAASGAPLVAGRVIQPWQSDSPDKSDARNFSFNSGEPAWPDEFMGGNFSIARQVAWGLGGFDENFVRVAYRFEAEFSARARARGEEIVFVPEASLFHLKVASGGTRHFGDHLRTWLPAHSVGAYYYILRADRAQGRMAKVLMRMIRSIRTRHHAAHPWHIPATLCAEMSGLVWAIWLNHCGPRLLQQRFGATFE
jgi:GT2 family glycosyltransferase